MATVGAYRRTIREFAAANNLRQFFNGADDGIRTRDPHLGKVAEPVRAAAAECADLRLSSASRPSRMPSPAS